MFKLLLPIAVGLLSGCLVVPLGAPRPYAGARIAVTTPAPVVVVRPTYYYRYR